MIKAAQRLLLLFTIFCFAVGTSYADDKAGGAPKDQTGSIKNKAGNSSTESDNKIAPLIRIDAVTSISGDIGEGGFDVRIQGGTWFMAKLNDCGEAIANIGRQWASQYELQLIKESVGTGRTVLHIGSQKLNGFFELLYRLKKDPIEASISLYFYNNSGLPVAPELSHFEGLELMSLAGDLKGALQCNP